jgi:hypothetical protein
MVVSSATAVRKGIQDDGVCWKMNEANPICGLSLLDRRMESVSFIYVVVFWVSQVLSGVWIFWDEGRGGNIVLPG